MATTGGHGFDGVERRGLMFVLSSPSGAGKTTMSRMLMQRMPNMRMSVSVTTRPIRPGEVEGRDYRFVDKVRFEEMAAGGELLEWAYEMVAASQTGHLVDLAAVRQMLDEHRVGTSDHSRRLWTVLIFMLWHAIFVEHSVTPAISEPHYPVQL